MKKTSGDRAEVGPKSRIRRSGFRRLSKVWNFETKLLPNLSEPLSFTVVVAEHMHGVPLAGPTMKLSKEFTSLRFGHLRVGCRRGEGTKGVEVLEGQGGAGRVEFQLCELMSNGTRRAGALRSVR